MRAATITPDALRPGDSAVIEVEIRDRFKIVHRVEARVVEEPAFVLPLRDDGEGADAKAGDGRWTIKVDVPNEAPAGTFNLEISAYHRDGRLIEVREGVRGTAPLRQALTVEILGPQP